MNLVESSCRYVLVNKWSFDVAINFGLLARDAAFGPATDIFVDAMPNELLGCGDTFMKFMLKRCQPINHIEQLTN